MIVYYNKINSNCRVNYSSIEYLEYDDGLEEVVRDEPGLNSVFIVNADSKGMFLNTDYSKKSMYFLMFVDIEYVRLENNYFYHYQN